jgi:hypothetical protein
VVGEKGRAVVAADEDAGRMNGRGDCDGWEQEDEGRDGG